MTATAIENLTLEIKQEIHVRASLEATYAALLDQIGPHNETPDGTPMPLKLEPWPGGRWYRDLGDNNGHFGWTSIHERVRKHAESSSSRTAAAKS